MTQAELWQLQLLAVSNGITAFGLLLALITGYLVTAYFAGSRLSRYQAAVVSLLFLLGAGLDAIMLFAETRRAYFFIDRLTLEFAVQSFTPSIFTVYLMGTLLALLIPAALIFMYQIRRNPKLGAGPGQADSNQGRRYFD
jgi:hypothetical protein